MTCGRDDSTVNIVLVLLLFIPWQCVLYLTTLEMFHV